MRYFHQNPAQNPLTCARRADPYTRLRVPCYLKAFEVLFFAILLSLYYVVLVQRSFNSISTAEVFLYIFLAGFAYEECKG
jgi:hypothetical protein